MATIKSIEEKAKAYDEAIEKVKDMLSYKEVRMEDMEYLFPELKVSDDERIIKSLLWWMQSNSYTSIAGIPIKDVIVWLEKQAEQKPVDKVEQKFKVGDWFVKNDGSHINREYNTCKISKVGNGYYAIESIYGDKGKITFETFDTNYHRWTIHEAKNGDVLANKYGDVMLFKGITNDRHICGYCQYSAEDRKLYNECSDFPNYYPATKEQHDLLFQKMKEAGYEWDAEKKELKKISQRMISAEAKEAMYDKPAWSEEDENRINRLIAYFEDKESFTAEDDIVYANWLKSLKERVQPQPPKEWSEENDDEAWLNDIICKVESDCTLNKDKKNWLKSLRPKNRWKPSDKQMEALDDAIDICSKQNNDIGDWLDNLREQLKKLREE